MKKQAIETNQGDRVFLGDTMGELRTFYELADVVFVGRTLNGWGGSDPMEPAALAKPIVVGPDTGNFEEAIAKFRANDAICVVQRAEELAEQIVRLLGEDGAAMATRAKQTVLDNQGATRRTVERIESFLPTCNAKNAKAD